VKAVRSIAVLALLGAVAVGCGGSDEPDATPTTGSTTTSTAAPGTTPSTAAPGPPVDLGAIAVRLTKVGSFDQPLAMTWCAGHPQPFVAEKTGKVRTLAGATVLDLSSEVSDGSEQGLLGIACSPDGTRLYADHTNRDGDERLVEYPLRAEVADPAAARTLVSIDDPAPNHNGGNLAFGPDGKLWYGVGDGGGADDQFGNGQRTSDLMGDLLRLDPAAGGRPEVVVTGLRNPWRWSFDRETGDLWIGDVGQNAIEEVDHLPAGRIDGANLGWPAFEGSHRFRKDVAAPAGAIGPVFEYGHDEGQAVVGGYVYRGAAIPAMVGAYVFADTYQGVLRVLDPDASTSADRSLQAVPGKLISSFAEDPAGELFVLSLDGGVYRLDPA
jgi:glucose/arabinose dehydrogenase